MNETLQRLQNQRDQALQEGRDVSAIDQQISDLETQKGQLEERLQQQAADLEDIQLPQDYNALFDDHRANDAIKGLLRQVIEQLYSQHNDELAGVHESYQGKLKAADEAHADLKDAYNALKDSFDRLGNELGAVTTEKQKLEDELQDALSKRDAAASQLSEAFAERDKALKDVDALKGQINELEGMVRTYKKPSLSTGLKLTPTIADETPEERAARTKREETERLNARLAERGVAPLPMPPLPELPVKVPTQEDIQKQTEAVQEAADEAARFPEVVSGDPAGQEAESGAGEAVADADAPALTLEQLDHRVKMLEKAVFWQREQGGVSHRRIGTVASDMGQLPSAAVSAS